LAEIKKLRYAPSLTSSVDDTQIANSDISYYARDPFVPTTTVGLSGRFGKKQIGLTAALLGTFAANLRAKR
jgi:hypothetical protein